MSQYRIVMAGHDAQLENDMFNMLSSEYELLSCSIHKEDVLNHINLLNPDILIIDITEDTKEASKLKSISDRIWELKIAVILIGEWDDCEKFQHDTDDLASLIIPQPTNALVIGDKFADFMEKQVKKNGPKEKAPAATEKASVSIDDLLSGKKPDAAAKPASGKKHILVVDDDPLMLKLLKEQLHDEYEVATAISGKVALKFLEARPTDLMLLDYEMPDFSGADVLAEIRSNPATANFPVVFLTGVTDKEKIAKVVEKKPQGYLLKPIEKDKLIATIKKLIG